MTEQVRPIPRDVLLGKTDSFTLSQQAARKSYIEHFQKNEFG